MYSRWNASPYDLELYHHGIKGQETLIVFDRSKTMKEVKTNEVNDSKAYYDYLTSQQNLARMRARRPV